MNIFDIINCILFKKKKIDSINLEDDNVFQPYLINRWLSFYNKQIAVVINNTMNRFVSICDDKNEMFKIYKNLIPSQPFKKITYCKKQKKEKNEDTDKKIEAIASNNMISQREVKMYIALSESYSK